MGVIRKNSGNSPYILALIRHLLCVANAIPKLADQLTREDTGNPASIVSWLKYDLENEELLRRFGELATKHGLDLNKIISQHKQSVWNCRVCTFENPPNESVCAMCTQSRFIEGQLIEAWHDHKQAWCDAVIVSRNILSPSTFDIRWRLSSGFESHAHVHSDVESVSGRRLREKKEHDPTADQADKDATANSTPTVDQDSHSHNNNSQHVLGFDGRDDGDDVDDVGAMTHGPPKNMVGQILVQPAHIHAPLPVRAGEVQATGSNSSSTANREHVDWKPNKRTNSSSSNTQVAKQDRKSEEVCGGESSGVSASAAETREEKSSMRDEKRRIDDDDDAAAATHRAATHSAKLAKPVGKLEWIDGEKVDFWLPDKGWVDATIVMINNEDNVLFNFDNSGDSKPQWRPKGSANVQPRGSQKREPPLIAQAARVLETTHSLTDAASTHALDAVSTFTDNRSSALSAPRAVELTTYPNHAHAHAHAHALANAGGSLTPAGSMSMPGSQSTATWRGPPVTTPATHSHQSRQHRHSTSLTTIPDTSHSSIASIAAVSDPRSYYREQLEQLKCMGFTDEMKNIQALQQANGQVEAAINTLLPIELD
eukprot:CAMPEP_0197542424 /NCGR_PEP_ID=MMETSP1318-20131121/67696_1 /TAXON_ID=552666 /ORGANISM="Partenskyella glossopodia, Strain RCC365" /LENGTH=596 /DNA_ID=CAMNT_0043101685 /DNA_START=634 /DNA_END=2424 /DNA_ORIENTATION=-